MGNPAQIHSVMTETLPFFQRLLHQAGVAVAGDDEVIQKFDLKELKGVVNAARELHI